MRKSKPTIFLFILLLPLPFLLTTEQNSLQHSTNSITHTTIFKDKRYYSAFPSIFVLNKKVFVKFIARHQNSHYDTSGIEKVFKSINYGRTWSETDENPYNPTYSNKDNSKLCFPFQSGWKFINNKDAQELSKEGIELRYIESREQYAFSIGAGIQTSIDLGKSWEKRQLKLPKMALLRNYNSSSFLKKADGSILYILYGKNKINERLQPFILSSDARCERYNFYPMFPTESFTTMGFGEVAAVELQDGRIVVLMRPDPVSIGFLFQSESRDGGRTWSSPVKTTLRGYPAHLLRIREDIILSTYGYRWDPLGIRATFSYDGGKTWDIKNEVILRDDSYGEGRDVGYPITVDLGNGQLLTVYYITSFDRITHIASTSWRYNF